MFSEITRAWAYRELSRDTFGRLLTVLVKGSESLKEYPEYRRLEERDDGRFILVSKQAARRHRMGIGTIVSQAHVRVKMRRRKPWKSKSHLQADTSLGMSFGFQVNVSRLFGFLMVN